MVTLTNLMSQIDHYCLNSDSTVMGKFFLVFFFSRSPHAAFSIGLNMAYWNKKGIYLLIDFKVALSLDCPQVAGPPLSSHIIQRVVLLDLGL